MLCLYSSLTVGRCVRTDEVQSQLRTERPVLEQTLTQLEEDAVLAAQLHSTAPSEASLQLRSQQWQKLWYSVLAPSPVAPCGGARDRQAGPPPPRRVPRHLQAQQPAQQQWRQQWQQAQPLQQRHPGGSAAPSHVVVPLSAISGGGQVLQVLMPDGRLGVVLPIVSPQPSAGTQAWRPQQHSVRQSSGVVPPPMAPPAPPPPPRTPLPSPLPPNRQPPHSAGTVPTLRNAPIPTANQFVAERLRKRLRKETHEVDDAVAASASADMPGFPTGVEGPRTNSFAEPSQRSTAPGEAEGGWAVPDCIQRLQQSGDDSELLFLGTGAAEPSKYRGASGIHLRCLLLTTLHLAKKPVQTFPV